MNRTYLRHQHSACFHLFKTLYNFIIANASKYLPGVAHHQVVHSIIPLFAMEKCLYESHNRKRLSTEDVAIESINVSSMSL